MVSCAEGARRGGRFGPPDQIWCVLFSVNKFRHKSHPPALPLPIQYLPSLSPKPEGRGGFEKKFFEPVNNKNSFLPLLHLGRWWKPTDFSRSRVCCSPNDTRRGRINRDCVISREKRARAKLRKGKYAIGHHHHPNIVSRIVSRCPPNMPALRFPPLLPTNPVAFPPLPTLFQFTYYCLLFAVLLLLLLLLLLSLLFLLERERRGE